MTSHIEVKCPDCPRYINCSYCVSTGRNLDEADVKVDCCPLCQGKKRIELPCYRCGGVGYMYISSYDRSQSKNSA